MNKRNYMRELDRIIEKRGGRRPRVLLHSCCGPCSSSVLEYLTRYFDVTLLWYNPNLYPQEEFERRFATQIELIEKMGLTEEVSVLAESWKHEDYLSRAAGMEDEPEGGRRCTECFRLRLLECAKLAKKYGFDYFCTTLTVSRHKDALPAARRAVRPVPSALLRLRILAPPPRGGRAGRGDAIKGKRKPVAVKIVILSVKRRIFSEIDRRKKILRPKGLRMTE